MNRSSDCVACFGGLAAIIIGIVLFAVIVDSFATKTSGSVETVAHNTARIEQGDRLVIVQQAGKIRYEWRITYDGRDSVKLECVGCRDKHGILGYTGEKIEVDLGWGSPSFYFTRRDGGYVDVRWPDGWSIYR